MKKGSVHPSAFILPPSHLGKPVAVPGQPLTAGDVVKVGGSLFSWRDFPGRLRSWLSRSTSDRTLLMAGGGPLADEVRRLDACFDLGVETAHRLAVRAMSLQSHVLAAVLGGVPVAGEWAECEEAWRSGNRWVVLDPLVQFQARWDALESGWHVTSDSIAAFLARQAGANRLVLMKSVGGDRPITIPHAVRQGWLDSYFSQVVGTLPVLWVNLRSEQSVPLHADPTAPDARSPQCGLAPLL